MRSDWFLGSMLVLGVGCFGILSLAFFLARHRIYIFNSFATIVMFAFVWIGLRAGDWRSFSEFLVMGAGLFLYWFGLLIVRVMLTRSVSLNLLARCTSGESGQSTRTDIAARLEDAGYYRLIREVEHRYSLTWFGRFVAAIVATVYSIFRIE